MTNRLQNPGVVALTVLLATLGTSPAHASEVSAAQAVVTAWVGEFNRGNLRAFVARCAPAAAVIDGFPPYAWTSCARWMSAYAINGKAIKLTDGKLSIGAPASAFSEGGRVYLVYPATFSDKENGTPVAYKGTWTITLQKMANRWAITGSGSNWGGNYTVRSQP